MTPSMEHRRAKAAREATPERRHGALGGAPAAARRPDLPPAAAAVLGLQRSIGNQATVQALRSAGGTSGASPLVIQRKPTDAPGDEGSTALWSAVGELVKVYNQHAGSAGSSAPTNEAKEPVSESGGGTEGGAPTTTRWERGKYALGEAGGGAERRASTPIGQQRRGFSLPRSGGGAGPSAPQDEVAGIIGGSSSDAAMAPMNEPLAPINAPQPPKSEPEAPKSEYYFENGEWKKPLSPEKKKKQELKQQRKQEKTQREQELKEWLQMRNAKRGHLWG